VYWVNNGDNYTKLFTLLTYFRLPRFRRSPMGAVAAHRLAREFEAIRVVDETIQNRVGVGRIPNLKMPAVLWDLRRHDGRGDRRSPPSGRGADRRPLVR
jgi:hypothetical protein